MVEEHVAEPACELLIGSASTLLSGGDVDGMNRGREENEGQQQREFPRDRIVSASAKCKGDSRSSRGVVGLRLRLRKQRVPYEWGAFEVFE